MPTKKKQTVAERLQKKADEAKDEKVIRALMSTDIRGLGRKEAMTKLANAYKDAAEE